MAGQVLPMVIGSEAEPRDMPLIAAALAAEGLPSADLPGRVLLFVFREPGGGTIGFAGLEPFGAAALLRSLVVLPPARARAQGSAIVAWMAEEAQRRGIGEIFLLTTTAAPFFEKLGFHRITRDTVPSSIAASPEFTTLCPNDAVAMARRLRPERD
jgi:N-acetylglutamate synthase-like GNAT family acetyltransferase